MAGLRFEQHIRRTPETVFQLIANLQGYRSWLPASDLYREMSISEQPVKVGTTYLDRGPRSEMRGEVTELEPFSHIAFHQASQIKLPLLSGNLDIRIRYTLQPLEQGTLVIREVNVRTQGPLALARPVLLRAIRKENERILQRMKWYLEAR